VHSFCTPRNACCTEHAELAELASFVQVMAQMALVEALREATEEGTSSALGRLEQLTEPGAMFEGEAALTILAEALQSMFARLIGPVSMPRFTCTMMLADVSSCVAPLHPAPQHASQQLPKHGRSCVPQGSCQLLQPAAAMLAAAVL
jgi:hypothetical protein